MSIIYKQNEFDVSDEGTQANQIINNAEVNLALTRLTQKERKICELIEFGYSQRQICEELKISHHTIRATLNKVLDIIK